MTVITRLSPSTPSASDCFSPISENDLFACSNNISRLSSQDAETFRYAFEQDALYYAKSWLYLLRSTRDDEGALGYKFIDKETYMGIGYRNNRIHIVHPIGPGRFEATRDIVEALRQRFACPIILKKVDQELYDYLSSTGVSHPFLEPSPLCEEEAFPEHILPLSRLYDPADDLYKQSLPFMRKVRRFERTGIHFSVQTNISDIESQPGFCDLFGAHSEKYKNYLQIIQEVSSQEPNNDTYKTCAYIGEDDMLRGLYITERLDAQSMGLYCAVVARVAPGATEWMDHDFFRRVFDDGISSLYLGGSETKGVHAYVQKLLPIEPSYLQRPMYCNYDHVLLGKNIAAE